MGLAVQLGFEVMFWVSGLIYLIPLKHRKHFPLRLAAAFFICAVFGGIIILLRQEMGMSWSPILVMHYILITVILFLCGEMKFTAAMYCGVWATISYQLIYEVWGFLVQLNVVGEKGIRQLLFATLFFMGCYCLLGVTIARWMPEKGRYTIGPRQLGSALILLLLFELILNLLNAKDRTGIDRQEMAIIILVQLYCGTVLYIQNELFRKSAMRQELLTLNLLRQQQEEQYSLSKENIALINRKCHDLKHQIRALRDMVSEEERERYLKEIEDSVEIYESIVKTGNEVLDIILTEKSLYCRERQISINCVADGRQLNFIDSVDLYTIFGNAIDNAIESVQQFREQEKRQIDVLIYTNQQFLVINIINPSAQLPEFEDNLPVTTKRKKGYHGYGLKSIRHTVKKYDGFLSVAIEDECFSLKILFPVAVTSE